MDELVYYLKLSENELKLVLYDYLADKEMVPIFEDVFVYAKGNILIMLVAHMDTVFDVPPRRLHYDKKNDVLFSYDGGIGAMKAVSKLSKPDVKYIIEFDRRGSNDCVFYDCGNIEFIDYIQSFGFVTDYGTFSDISVLGSKWDIAAVNLSCGYYNEHIDNEYIKFKELQNNIVRVKKMLKKHKQAKYFDYQEIKYIPQSYSQYLGDWQQEDFMLYLNSFCSLTDKSRQQEHEKILRKNKKLGNENGDR